MKIRLTILTENDKKRPNGLTEEKTKLIWQATLDLITSISGDETATVEKVEFVDEEEPHES